MPIKAPKASPQNPNPNPNPQPPTPNPHLVDFEFVAEHVQVPPLLIRHDYTQVPAGEHHLARGSMGWVAMVGWSGVGLRMRLGYSQLQFGTHKASTPATNSTH